MLLFFKYKQFDYAAATVPIASGIREDNKKSNKLKKKADNFLKLVEKHKNSKKKKAIQQVMKAREKLKLLAIELMRMEEEEFAMFILMMLSEETD